MSEAGISEETGTEKIGEKFAGFRKSQPLFEKWKIYANNWFYSYNATGLAKLSDLNVLCDKLGLNHYWKFKTSNNPSFQFNTLYRPSTIYTYVVCKTIVCELEVWCHYVLFPQKQLGSLVAYWTYQNRLPTIRMAKFLFSCFMSQRSFLSSQSHFSISEGIWDLQLPFSSLHSESEPSPLDLKELSGWTEAGRLEKHQRECWEENCNGILQHFRLLLLSHALYSSSFYLWGSVAFSSNTLLGQHLQCNLARVMLPSFACKGSQGLTPPTCFPFRHQWLPPSHNQSSTPIPGCMRPFSYFPGMRI